MLVWHAFVAWEIRNANLSVVLEFIQSGNVPGAQYSMIPLYEDKQ